MALSAARAWAIIRGLKPGSITGADAVAGLEVDASGKTVGRLATQIASLLRGKHKPTFAPHVDGGDYVIVVTATPEQSAAHAPPRGVDCC